jgi:branched-chain amino acid transport system permease protein
MRQFALYRMLIFGGAMVVMMVLRPQGLIASSRRRIALGPKDRQGPASAAVTSLQTG